MLLLTLYSWEFEEFFDNDNYMLTFYSTAEDF